MTGVHTAELSVHLATLQSPADASPPPLGDDHVQVWQVFQPAMMPHLAEFSGSLSHSEAQRASRFRFDKDRNQFTIARGLLRTLLGQYLGTSATEIEFAFSEKGKPSVAGPAVSNLQFNVAHSGELILLAFSRGRRLGVDIEQVRTDFATAEIADRFFSKSEVQCLRSIPASDRHEAFFRCWTRKEAYIKATGDGLSLPLHQFDVTLRAGEPAHLLATRPDPSEAERWAMYHLHVQPGYAAALVVERLR